ncbi:MAG TPA: radical SAM protein [Candidatus Nanoarchaeia archaeon]|nr:radical SAM protein [Candidatus Nanoarchaeia archaeon]
MEKTKYYSYKIGKLPKGCQLCVKGQKMVLFVTGLCPRCCYFCPISDAKFQNDVVYADEWPVKNASEIIKEAQLIDAKGAGITGGDPLCRLDRVVKYIKILKKEFGKKFHIHLYTSLNLVTKEKLAKLYKAGLDEIRFHLEFDTKRFWEKIQLALDLDWDVGVEIPAIPKKEKQIRGIILFLNSLHRKPFLNLNELEVADNKTNKLLEMGYRTKNELSYAVKGSEELALGLLKFVEKNKIKLNVHYCTATLKDRVQLAERIKRRARHVRKPYVTVTPDGTLIRGAIYLAELKPDFGYRKKLKNAEPHKYMPTLRKILSEIKKEFKITDVDIDPVKLRLVTSVKNVESIRDKINAEIFSDTTGKALFTKKKMYLTIVEEYPTYDQTEISVEFL